RGFGVEEVAERLDGGPRRQRAGEQDVPAPDEPRAAHRDLDELAVSELAGDRVLRDQRHAEPDPERALDRAVRAERQPLARLELLLGKETLGRRARTGAGLAQQPGHLAEVVRDFATDDDQLAVEERLRS